MKSTIAAIDFGTSKIVTLISETSGNQRCDIIGAGIAAYDGYIDGEWNNPVRSKRCDIAVRHRGRIPGTAQAQGNQRRAFRASLRGCMWWKQSVTIQGADPRVSPKHVEKIFAEADKQLSPCAAWWCTAAPRGLWWTAARKRWSPWA